MNRIKFLSNKGAVLDRKQLETYLEKVASDHILKKQADKNTYPIPRVKDNFDWITKTYQFLNQNVKEGIHIHPAGEWLLDNYYVLEETVKAIEKELTEEKYQNFLGIQGGFYDGYARVYVLAHEIVAYTDGRIDREHLEHYLQAYQKKKTLNMEEIWNIGLFLQIAILENIRQICEKIYFAQIQKYKVENIVSRLVEKKNISHYQTQLDDFPSHMTFVDMKYPFIEYMSYRLKKMGRKAISYQKVLEEEVRKMGTNVAEVIQKEHFDVAVKKVSMGNCIESIKSLQRMNFLEIFEHINGVEEILRCDPAGIYEKMDYETKNVYRNRIKEISAKTKISEIYIASKALELANLANMEKINSMEEKKKTHIGYYFLAEGQENFMRLLGSQIATKTISQKFRWYKNTIQCSAFLLAVIVTILCYQATQAIWLSILAGLLFWIPLSELVVQIVQTFLGRKKKPSFIPKLDFSKGIPQEYATMVVIPTILESPEKVKKMIEKLEVYAMANASENLYFTLLGDCQAASKKVEEMDTAIVNTGVEEVQKLNAKYPGEDFPKFHFVYRRRTWSNSEQCYLGWERKRGLLTQLNNYLLGKSKDVFRANTMELWKLTGENKKIPPIRYIMTLDADTELVLNSGLRLVGAMAHLLNQPIVEEETKMVVEGYGMMQPRIGIRLKDGNRSLFSRLFAGLPGTDLYTNAISDVYQDNFHEGIFTGKGIYDLVVFQKVMDQRIPENRVLSHDLLEGSFARCALVTDILWMDDYPNKFMSSMKRKNRWIRGDWQIASWCNQEVPNANGKLVKNTLSELSRYKIWDNLRRSTIEIGLFFSLMITFGVGLKFPTASKGLLILWIIMFGMPVILHLLFQKEPVARQRFFSPMSTGLQSNLLATGIQLTVLPAHAYNAGNAIGKAIYRQKVSHRKLLEWMTAEEAEKSSDNTKINYIQKMWFQFAGSLLCFGFAFFLKDIWLIVLSLALGILWLAGPWIAWYISQEQEDQSIPLSQEEEQYLREIGKRTWQYFADYMIPKTNGLPPDNYQEERTNEVVYRTSSTNIGLGLMAIISAYDLGYINEKDAFEKINITLNTIDNLSKWNGHLYNWYDIQNLKPLYPRYVSTVDSGNFVGYLYTLKSFLKEKQEKMKNKEENEQLQQNLEKIDRLIQNTDFSYLYDNEKGIFSIGFDVENNLLTDSYYDLLASESRQASLVAIAKKDVPAKHWNHLSRILTSMNGYKGLLSWSGTAFEYLMPNMNIPTYSGSLLDESCHFLIMSQMTYCKKLEIPWGISEAAFHLKDLHSNYQYKAFGIPWLGLKRGLGDELNIAPYASALAMLEKPHEVIQNLKALEQLGMFQKYGFYEALDFTPEHLDYGTKQAPVKTYMAHHQALILMAIDNVLNQRILQKRFMKNPEIKAIDILLQERMPLDAVVTKEKKEKVEKLKMKDYEQYSENVFTALHPTLNNYHVYASGEYMVCQKENGEGFSSYQNIYINKYKETNDYAQGIFFYVKNLRTHKVYASYQPEKSDKFSIHFTPDGYQMTRMDETIEMIEKDTISPDEPVEIRRVTLKNHGNLEEIVELTVAFEPVLSTKEQEYAHPAFNNLFLKYNYDEVTHTMFIQRNQRGSVPAVFLGASFYTEQETIGELEYEIDKQKFYDRGNIGIPKCVEQSIPFSQETDIVTNPILAMRRTIKIKPGEKVHFNFVVSLAKKKESVRQNIEKYRNEENVLRAFELSKAKVEEENRYLGIKGKEIETYQKLLSYLMFQNPMRKLYLHSLQKQSYAQEDLWPYGISGDLPILLFRMKESNDRYFLTELLKAYEYFMVKNVAIDFVILDEEENVYEKYVKKTIEEEVNNRQLNERRGIKGGIFILQAAEIEDIQPLLYRANILLDASFGDLKNSLETMEEDYQKSLPILYWEPDKQLQNDQQSAKMSMRFEEENLLYYNGYGGFTPDGKEYKMRINQENKLPTVWAHVLANPYFGTVLTENMGGYTWNQNSRLNRLTAWGNDPVMDIPSEIIYIKDKENQKLWSLGYNPIPDENDYLITYGFGYARYEHHSDGILQETNIFVPREDRIKIHLIKLKNVENRVKNLKMVYYLKPVLGEEELKSNSYIDVTWEAEEKILYAKNQYTKDFNNGWMFVSCSEPIHSFTSSKRRFLGQGGIQDPDGLKQAFWDQEVHAIGQSTCLAVEIDLTIPAYGTMELSFMMGQEQEKEKAQEQVKKYKQIAECKRELHEIRKEWSERLQVLQIQTPEDSMNIMLNGWAFYQTIACRLWAKTGFYQSGGAYGFRDQLQDTLGIKYWAPEMMRAQILKHAAHQFIEGDVEHWWHEETGKGIRTKFSDDLLWLIYVTCEYVKMTNDSSIWEEEITYRTGPLLDEHTDENYDWHPESQVKENLFQHCVRALKKGVCLGEHGLPKIGSGDWNDAFNTVGNQGRGESVWLGFFLYNVLQRFLPICQQRQEEELALFCEQTAQELKRQLNEQAWDGRWYRRAFTDDGRWIGSAENEEGRIDSIAQSWSVISGAGDNDKKFICMEHLDKYLVDREHEIIKLLTPAFDKSDLEPGYIKAYLPGVRENGGQYTHGAVWSVWANCLLNFPDRAVEYYHFINPIEHARTKEAIRQYKVEPYVLAADMYGVGKIAGRGGWTWYTGSSSWFLKIGIEKILGFQIEPGYIVLDPHIPAHWKEYQIKYKYQDSIYQITIKNNRVEKNVFQEKSKNKHKIKLENNHRINEIEIQI